MKKKHDNRFTTTHEVDFINQLGEFSTRAQRITGEAAKRRKQRLLLQYIELAEGRKHWGEVDKAAVVRHACKLAGVER